VNEVKKSFNFIGVCMDAVTYSEMFEKVDMWRRNKEGRSRHIACLNAFCVTLALRDSRLRRIYNGADISGPDGMPFVRWIRTFGRTPCDRFAAPDILLQLAARAKETGYTFYLYGGAPDVVKKMKQCLEEWFPHIQIVGYHSPPFRPLTEEEDRDICDKINRLKPDIICVGLGTPKQDYWIEDHLDLIHGAVFVASGATFDFFGGRIKMAPEFVRNSGFEWLYRLFGKDFRRLWYRYTVLNLVFLWNYLLQLSRLRRYPGQRWQRSDKGSLQRNAS
jgi:N-acetylglucosaminyldiphosphoundecaprenol N-acetyl-beta-D-mannosaminyltransferase